MKIAVFSNNGNKFVQDLVDHWNQKGHEAKFEMGANLELARESDVVFVSQYDANIHHLYNSIKDKGNTRYYCRALDWDVWAGLMRDQTMYDWLDGAFCIAPHIQREIEKYIDTKGKLHLVRLGVDHNKFTYTEKTEIGNQAVIPCNEIDWVLKNVLEGIKIAGMMGWDVTLKGKWTGQSGGDYFRVVIDDLAKKLGISVKMVEEHVPDYNAFLEGFDYCIQPSVKEAFSFTVAECALKGIIPIVNNWYGAEEIWHKDWLYVTPVDVLERVEWHPLEYRNYVMENYSLERYFRQMDEVMGL